MWRQPPRLSAERSDARVERTLLYVDFGVDLDFDFARVAAPVFPPPGKGTISVVPQAAQQRIRLQPLRLGRCKIAPFVRHAFAAILPSKLSISIRKHSE
jgi:hypothetical protein